MGQMHSSDSYNCAPKAPPASSQDKFADETSKSVHPKRADAKCPTAKQPSACSNQTSNISSRTTRCGGSGNSSKWPVIGNNSSEKAYTEEQKQQQHVRKLSNVSNRNIQLLSMKSRSEREAYADGLRSRRRSSLINLILGAPSSGPKFSDDLCSLSSHMSELCNFGIDYFPDPATHYATKLGGYSTTSSSMAKLEEEEAAVAGAAFGPGTGRKNIHAGSCVNWGLANEQLVNVSTMGAVNQETTASGREGPSECLPDDKHHGQCHQHQHCHHGRFHRRRRSSLGSLSSFESFATTDRINTATAKVAANLGPVSQQSTIVCDCTKSGNPFMCISFDPANKTKIAANDEKEGITEGEPKGDKVDSHEQQRGPDQIDRHRPQCDHIGVGGDHGLSERREFYRRRPSLSSIFLASVDLTSSMDEHCCVPVNEQQAHLCSFSPASSCRRELPRPPLVRSGQSVQFGARCDSACSHESQKSATTNTFLASKAEVEAKDGQEGEKETETRHVKEAAAAVAPDNDIGGQAVTAKRRINQAATATANTTRRMFHRSGSELSLYSSATSTSSANLSHHQLFHHHNSCHDHDQYRQQQQQHHHHHCHQHQCQYQRTSANFTSNPLQVVSRRGSRIGTNVLSSGYYGGGGGGGDSVSRKRLQPSHLVSGSNREQRQQQQNTALVRETKLIIMLQVCLPFILAGFGNMAAGLVLNKLAQREAFRNVPIFFVLLPSFVGLKGNIEMTLASRLSTLANLNLLDTSYQRRHAYVSNLILILSQAIGLSIFAGITSMLCEFSTGKLDLNFYDTLALSAMVVLPCALLTSIVLVFISSFVMASAIWLANQIQVNPDNLSTLIAAMYGDVSCVLTYGLFAELMYTFYQKSIFIWPVMINCSAILSWPVLWYSAYQFKETHDLSMTSMPPMLTGIVVSLGSGTILSLVVGRFSRIALYQPVVNGFGANLIAVQASRVSTWLWCTALRRLSNTLPPPSIGKDKLEYGHLDGCKSSKLGTSLVSFTEALPDKSQPDKVSDGKINRISMGRLWKKSISTLQQIPKLALKCIKLLLWSFLNPSPNSVAARLLLIMLVPAHSLYFIVIWLLSPAHYILITWQFYSVYVALCLTQVFVLLTICEPLMTFLMSRHLDPDIFGISLLMALADLVGTLCLTGGFMLLASIGDPNAL